MMVRSTTMLGALLCAAVVTSPGAAQPNEKVGDAYVITREARTSTESDNQSSSSTFDRDTISERVVGVRGDGLELQYDLPDGATAEDRARSWQFPARIFRPARGAPLLINRAELEARIDRWLKDGKLPRTACGHWAFTWNAFKIECDPQSVLETIAAFDLRPADLRDGAPYRDTDAKDPAPLKKVASENGGATYTVTLLPDADKVRHDRAQSDVVVGEISRKPVTLDAALRARSNEQVTGSITISFDTDAAGAVIRRTKIVKLEIKGSNGVVEKSTATETLRRERASPRRTKADSDTI